MLYRSILIIFTSFLLPFIVAAQKDDSLIYKIGQMIMIGLSGSSVDTGSNLYRDVKAGKVGGITIYESNLTAINSAENLKAMISAYQAAAPIPLFVAITQEGGLVNRLKTKYGFPPVPSAQYLGSLDKLDSTKYYADNVAFTLSRLGINVNFAPVVDIYMPANPVLGSRGRTYSDKIEVITRHAQQVVASHDYFKVIPVLKHFPGHGSSTTDSHLGLTDVSATWKQSELEPYRQLIKKGSVQAIMTAHIVNDRLDGGKHPATLSKKIINELLRKKMKFNGVVFSDDMHMKAISAEYGLPHSIELAINAGVDVLLFSGNIPGITTNGAGTIADIISGLVASGKISRSRINASYDRIMRLKNRSRTAGKTQSN
jgi:beta-N-acetylhexosaminidase